MADKPSPVQKITELEAEQTKLIAEREKFKTAAEKADTDLKAEQTAHGTTKQSLQKAQTDLQAEQSAHATTKQSLQKAQADLTAKTTEFDTLKSERDDDIQKRAAKIAADNGHTPVPTAAAKKPGETGADKPAAKGAARLAQAIKADLEQTATR